MVSLDFATEQQDEVYGNHCPVILTGLKGILSGKVVAQWHNRNRGKG